MIFYLYPQHQFMGLIDCTIIRPTSLPIKPTSLLPSKGTPLITFQTKIND